MNPEHRDAPSTPLDVPGALPSASAPLPRSATERWQSLGEEIANSISHGLALLAALAVSPWLVMHAARDGDTANVVGAAVFAASMVLLYFTSMLYHALPASRLLGPSRSKRLFQVLDHSAIYLLIAGTYTPFTLGVLRGPWGWTLFGLVWAMALGGVALKAFAGIRWPRLSTALYVGMGWIAVVAVQPLWQRMPGWGLFWLVAGGLAYTLGVVFFATDHRVKYGHFVWHIFVAVGTACHCVAVYYYAF